MARGFSSPTWGQPDNIPIRPGPAPTGRPGSTTRTAPPRQPVYTAPRPATPAAPPRFGTPVNTGWGGPQAPTAYSNSLYFQPGSTYGNTQSAYNTPLSAILREQNPQLAYAAYGNQMGIGDNDSAFNNWFYQQFPRFQRAYGLATMQNPNITIDTFMKSLPGMDQLRQQFETLSPGQRGLRQAAYAPLARWIGR